MTDTRHLVWDWNGTLLDDLDVVVLATNAAFASVGGPSITAEEHRRVYQRPIIDYYRHVLRRHVDQAEFERMDRVFHDAYRAGLLDCALAPDAVAAINSWTGTQSLLSMWFHDELIPEVTRRGLVRRLARIDGIRSAVGGGHKAEYLAAHLEALGVHGEEAVLIGDSVDDAHAAAEVGAACVLYAGGITDMNQLVATGRPVATTLLEAVQLAEAPTRIRR